MEKFILRKAVLEDTQEAVAIYESARLFLKESGIDQWQRGGPNKEMFLQDVQNGHAYVLVHENKIVALAAVLPGPDVTYQKIEEGDWHAQEEYTVIHRVAACAAWRGKGASSALFAAITFLSQDRPYLRIDTHADNLRMQGFLRKQGFSPCGKIYLENGDPRLGFDRLPGQEKEMPSLRVSWENEQIIVERI